MQYFIGLTFSQHYLQFKKIDSYRKRFDLKYHKSSTLQMTLLPPFKLRQQQGFDEIFEDIQEEFEGHLHGLSSEVAKIKFQGIDFLEGKTCVIFLKPQIPIDLFHAQENICHRLKNEKVHFKRYSKKGSDMGFQGKNLDVFLPIGRVDPLMVATAIDTARREFHIPFVLKAQSIALFEKWPGQWLLRKQLFSFDDQENSFERDLFDGHEFIIGS